MKKNKNYTSDRDIQVILGTLLRVGVIASMSVVLIGAALYLYANHAATINYSNFNAHGTKFSSISGVFSGLVGMDGGAVIQFGILLLIFTPVLRVVFSIFGFLIERDYLYVMIGLLVLAVILLSLSNKLAG